MVPDLRRPAITDLRLGRGVPCWRAGCRQRIALVALAPKRSAAARHILSLIAAATRSLRSCDDTRGIHAGLLRLAQSPNQKTAPMRILND